MENQENNTPLFGKRNYQLLFLGLIITAIGFILMIGGGSEDGVSFNEDIFSFQRITLAPIIILVGLVVKVVAILKNFDNKK